MGPRPGWTDRRVSLPGRGEIFVRESVGPAGAPTLVLLHGLAATGLLNWRTVLPVLARDYRVLVVDHRGHGRGLRSRTLFRLADCADDVAALAEVLAIPRLVAVGYSMGGPIAQLLWRRHPGLVAGLVLCATACRFSSATQRRMSFAATPTLNVLGRVAPRRLIRRLSRNWLSDRIEDPKLRAWILSEAASSDPIAIGQASAAILRFDSRDWIGEVDVPTAVLVMEQDEIVRAESQRRLAARIPGARVFSVQADHSACATRPELFVPALEQACAAVVADLGERPARPA